MLRSQLPSPPDGPRPLGGIRAGPRFPILGILGEMMHGEIGLGTQEEARGEFEAILGRLAGREDERPLEVAPQRRRSRRPALPARRGLFGKDTYHQWIIFDDLWAGEHPDLAEGILRYAKRWDVLTA